MKVGLLGALWCSLLVGCGSFSQVQTPHLAQGLAEDGRPLPGVASLPVAFGQDALSALWEFSVQGQRCVLAQRVPGYGEARFVRELDSLPSFELVAVRPQFVAAPVLVAALAPDWHPAYPQQLALAAVAEPEAGDIRLQGALAVQLLLQLREGYLLRFVQEQHSWAPTEMQVQVSPLHFRAGYARLGNCATELAQGQQAQARTQRLGRLADLAQTQVWFAHDSTELIPESRLRLDEMAALIQAELAAAATVGWLRQVRIDGHTDDTGSDSYNQRLSRQRAEIVAAYLQREGVPVQYLQIHYHAARQPVASNADAQGRQLNRRTQVRIFTREPLSAAAPRLAGR